MKRKLIQKKSIERDEILKALHGAIESEQAVQFAYVHGSFLQSHPFQDIDVAVYLSFEQSDPTGFALDLGARLENKLCSMGKKVPVDVQVLNHAPLGFRYHAFRGSLLSSKDESLRVQEVERTVARYLDIKPLRHRAVKEAMDAWT